MNTWMWVVMCMWGLESVVKVICLAVGRTPERTPAATALDALIGFGMVAWGLWVLK